MIGLLLSGGMDSISLAWWKRPAVAFTIDYGQIAAPAEISASATVCETLGIRHEVIRVDCSHLGSGDMAGTEALPFAPVPEWWPYRNQLILTIAASAGMRMGVTELMIGTVASDSAHADGRSDFITGISNLMQMQEGGITITAPAQHLSTIELVQTSGVPPEILAWAHSCHTGEVACGGCRGCVKHFEAWRALDHAPY